MIVSLQGTLLRKSPTEIVIDVQGVGYGVSIPLSTYERIGEVGGTATLLTYLHVREDILQLFGFATEEERALFRLLISVSGIGPKMAQGILSGISTGELRNHLLLGNSSALTAIPGVGKKLAERLVVELREKISKLESDRVLEKGAGSEPQVKTEAILGLTSLGYNRIAAEKAVREAIGELEGNALTVETLLKTALRLISKV
jgi:Holliday junction DNA helicase RuvA